MKNTDLRRCKIREIPARLRKKDEDGQELSWEVSAPAKLNGGRRFRRAYRTKAEAVAKRDRLVNKILSRGTKHGMTPGDEELFHRIKSKASEVNMPITVLESLLEREIKDRTAPTNFYRISDLFAYYRKEIAKGDGAFLGWMKRINDYEELFIEKWGDIFLRDVRKHHAEELLNDPPESGGKPRFWSIATKKTYRSVYSAVWEFCISHWTDDEGETYVPFNPWGILWFGSRRNKRGTAPVYDDITVLRAVYLKLGTVRSDMLPCWELELKCGLRPESELAGGRSRAEQEHNGRGPLTWKAVHLKGTKKFKYGYLDVWCHKTEKSGRKRRWVPFHRETQRLLKMYKPHFKDSDPILPGGISAYHQVLARVFKDVGMELYGKPLLRTGPKGERDMARHTCLSAFLNETDGAGNYRNKLNDVVRYAGHLSPRMLFEHYIGTMTGEMANAIFELAMPSDWTPRLTKAGPGECWYPEEAIAARDWGRLKAQKTKVIRAFPQTMELRDSVTGEAIPIDQFNQTKLHAPKLEKHGSTITN